MKPHKLVVLCGVLILLVAVNACNRLRARDQLNKGVGAFRNAQFQEAIVHFKTAVDLDPTLLNARLYLAAAYHQQYIPGAESPDNVKIGKQAIGTYEDVLKMDPKNSTAIASIAQIYYNMKNFDRAKEYQRRRLQVDPNDPEPYYWIGVIDWAIAYPRRMQVRRDMNLTMPKDPKQPDVLPPLPEKARVKLEQDNGALVDEGIQALQKAIDMKPNDADAMAYLNLMYREKADYEAEASARDADLKMAEEWVDKALNIKKQGAAKTSATS
ncbi:MAG: tetratricopeptide repeat protein [Acidobacteriia bacterium]|nr:tetratricopeptide repeat protein [Terriglobia bacterium]